MEDDPLVAAALSIRLCPARPAGHHFMSIITTTYTNVVVLSYCTKHTRRGFWYYSEFLFKKSIEDHIPRLPSVSLIKGGRSLLNFLKEKIFSVYKWQLPLLPRSPIKYGKRFRAATRKKGILPSSPEHRESISSRTQKLLPYIGTFLLSKTKY